MVRVLLLLLVSTCISFNAFSATKSWFESHSIIAPKPSFTLNDGAAKDFKSFRIREILATVVANVNQVKYDPEIKSQLNKLMYNPANRFIIGLSLEQDQIFKSLESDYYISSTFLDKSTSYDIAIKLLRTFLWKIEGIDRSLAIETLLVANSYSTTNLRDLTQYIFQTELFSPCNCFDGVWETNYGEITFTSESPHEVTFKTGSLNHSEVSGYYGDIEENKKLKGKVYFEFGKCVLKGKWIKNNSLSGDIQFVTSVDRKKFTGYWVHSDERHIEWKGSKVIGEAEDQILGQWITNIGTIVLYKIDDKIVGSFKDTSNLFDEPITNYIEGILKEEDSKYMIEGQWTKGLTSEGGLIELTFKQGENKLKGKWSKFSNINNWNAVTGIR